MWKNGSNDVIFIFFYTLIIYIIYLGSLLSLGNYF